MSIRKLLYWLIGIDTTTIEFTKTILQLEKSGVTSHNVSGRGTLRVNSYEVRKSLRFIQDNEKAKIIVSLSD